jgi:excisionase family DNA binding protein
MPHEPIGDLRTCSRRYLSPLQLAEYAGVARRTIYHHIDKGALRAVKVGGVLRIPIREARRYMGELGDLSAHAS